MAGAVAAGCAAFACTEPDVPTGAGLVTVASVRATAAVGSVRFADGSGAVVVALAESVAVVELDAVAARRGAAFAESVDVDEAVVVAEAVEVLDAVDVLDVDCAVVVAVCDCEPEDGAVVASASANVPVSSTRLTFAALSAPRSDAVSSVDKTG